MAKVTKVQLGDNINTHRNRFNDLIDDVGDAAALTTTATGDVSAAINELDAEIGNVNYTSSSLSATNITGALDELDGELETRAKAALSAGEGLDYNSSTGEISGEDATTSNKGIASFATADFSVTSGAVSIKPGGVSNTQLNGSITNAKLSNSSITINGSSVALGGSVNIDNIDSAATMGIIDSAVNAAYVQARQGNINTTHFAAATLITEAEGIGSNDNETTMPTSAAVKDYVDDQIIAAGSYNNGSVDAHLNQSTAATGEVLSWSGSDYDWVPAVDSARTMGIIDSAVDSTFIMGRVTGITTSKIAASTLVIESEGIGSNDNDTTIPTSAAVKDYVDGSIPGSQSVYKNIAVAGQSTATADSANDILTLVAGSGMTITTSGDNVTFASAAAGATSIDGLTDGSADGTSVGLGTDALKNDNGANANIGIGTQALCANIAGQHNVGIGFCSLRTTTGSCNTAVGSGSLFVNSSGIDNTALGAFALCSNVSGSRNVAIGHLAMADNTTGTGNTIVGRGAAQLGVGSFNNTAVGEQALYANIAENNTAIGKNALHCTSGAAASQNTAVGLNAGCNITTGKQNTVLGYGAMRNGTTGVCNIAIGINASLNGQVEKTIAIGHSALCSNTAGHWNLAIGNCAMKLNTNGKYNTVLGTMAMCAGLNSCENVAVGYSALMNITTGGCNNVAIGYESSQCGTTVNCNTAIGWCSLNENTCGDNNTAVGATALLRNQGSSNTAVGSGTLANNKGCENVAVGSGALLMTQTGSCNVAVGTSSLLCNTTGYGNIAVGNCAGHCNTIGNGRVNIGHKAGFGHNPTPTTAGFASVAIGYESMCNSSTGASNVAIGTQTLKNATYTTGNTVVGGFAGTNLTTGGGNVLVGMASGCSLTTGQLNTIIGYNTVGGTGLCNVTVIGNQAAASSGTATNEITLGNADITKVRVPGIGGFTLEDVDASSFKLYTNSTVLNTTWDSDNMIVQGNVTSLSDINHKENIRTIDAGLSLVDQLRGVRYTKKGSALEQIGVIAQEVEEVLPEVVLTGGDGVKSVAYGNIVGVLIEAIKELKAEIDQLKAGE